MSGFQAFDDFDTAGIDVKMFGQEFYQGLIGAAFNGRGGQIYFGVPLFFFEHVLAGAWDDFNVYQHHALPT